MARSDPTAAPLSHPDGTPIRVLAVDDEPSLTELLSLAMRYEGWQVTTADSGSSAVRAAREVRPDAIVLDMMLPDFDGLEVMRRIRTEDPDVPVIFLTAKDAVEDRINGLTAGGDDYVTKAVQSGGGHRPAPCAATAQAARCRPGVTPRWWWATSLWTRTATRSAAAVPTSR